MKKILIFGGLVIVLFIGIVLLTNMATSEKVEGNPYGKDSLHPETVKLLDNEHYQNVITPDELEEDLSSGETMTVYFFSPTCEHCREATPRLSPLAKEKGVDLKKFNLLEFEDGWSEYNIEATPTLIYYENGEEVHRIMGAAPTDKYEEFLEEYSLSNE
ncbi:thioredoxin family protein [Allobacillus halotolerans]|uniref:Thioredoxin family protein n=1 Tax=Allobacillus halotolerans TaxID=570278 RepID=A0ABS6GSY4_9BACI|nr:thioredoxin family protein [Allobacillus halotolerans]MBU6081710.1 thioredoxin family protein [Allobacillus halotolerans]